MDSGNSGSLQSSSGAEEECDSRAAVSDSGFINTTHHQPHQPPPTPFIHHIYDQNQINNPLFFDPPPHHQLLNLDSVVWSNNHVFPSSSQPLPLTPVTTATTTSTNPPTTTRNPKKRSRASRRAPTTVLTTDTNNFRAMVQEFTGIPAPPFTSSSPAFPRLTTSFDLFGGTSAVMRSNTNNFDNLPQLPPYLLRPFPQKHQSSQSSSSSISSLLDSSNLLTTMQNTITFPSNSFTHSPFLNPKITQNAVSSNDFRNIGESQINHEHRTTLPDLVSNAPTPTTTAINDDQLTSVNWVDGGGGNYSNAKDSSGMKGNQGFIEPWICSSD